MQLVLKMGLRLPLFFVTLVKMMVRFKILVRFIFLVLVSFGKPFFLVLSLA